MVEELKLAIKIDDASIKQSLLKQFSEVEKMADKVVLNFKNVNFDDKQLEAQFREMQRKAGKNPIDLSINDKSLKMLDQIDKRLTEIFNIGKGKSLLDSSSAFGNIENQMKDISSAADAVTKNVNDSVKSIEKLMNMKWDIKHVNKNLKDTDADKSFTDRSKNKLNASLNLTLSEDKNALSALENEAKSLTNRLREVDEMVDRISKNSSIDKTTSLDGLANAYQEIDSRLKDLNNQYKLSTTELEEYITLQVKAEKIINEASKSYGGVRGSGAKGKEELRTWIEQSFATRLGEDDVSKLFVNIIDSQYSSKFMTLFDEYDNYKKKTLTTLAGDILDYQGTELSGGFGAKEDIEKLKEYNSVLNYIKKNIEEIKNTDFSSQIKEIEKDIELCQNRLLADSDNDFWKKHLEENKQQLQELIELQERLNVAKNESVSNESNTDVVSNSSDVVKQQEKAQEVLKKTQEQAEKTEQALKESTSSTSDKSELDKVTTSADEAAKAKQEFVDANEKVQSSVDGSKSKLELETELMERLATAARTAADAKKEFVEANKQVQDSVDKTTGKTADKTDLSSGGTVSGKKDRYANAKRVSEDEYNQNYKKYADSANKYIKNLNAEILGGSVDVKFIDGLAQVNAKIKEADGSWKTFSAKVDADGNILGQRMKAVTKDVNQLDAELKNFGKDTPKIFDASKQKEWLDSFNVLKEFQKKNSELNNLYAGNTNGKNDFAIQELRKEIQALEPAAEKAKQTIQNLGTSAEALDKIGISAKQGAEAINLMDNAAKGSSKSIVSAVTTYEKFLSSANTDLAKFQKQKPMSETFSDNVTKLETEITKYSNLLAQVKANGGIASKEQNEQLNEYRNNISKLTTDIKEMSAAEKGAKEPGLSKIFKEIAELRDKYSGMGKEFKRELEAIEFQFKKAGDSLNLADAKKQLVDFEAQLIRTGNNSKSMFSAIKDKAFYGLAGQIANMVSLWDVINVIKQAASEVVQLNTDITDLAKVSEQSVKQIYSDFSSYADIAKEMGGTISDTISATTAWAKNGYSILDSKELARVSLLYKNVGDDITIDEANESLVSTLQGYKLAADDAEHIIDVFNEVSNNEAISSAGIGEALQRSAASFNAANTDLEKSVALVTATNSVLQDPEKVGGTYIADLYSNVTKIKVAISVNVQRWIRPSKDLYVFS